MKSRRSISPGWVGGADSWLWYVEVSTDFVSKQVIHLAMSRDRRSLACAPIHVHGVITEAAGLAWTAKLY